MGKKILFIIPLIWLLFPSLTLANLTFTSPSNSIDADQELEVQIQIDLTANSSYYLEGAFKKSDGANYFGLTWNDSDWISYQSTKSTSFKKITTDNQGKWEGMLKVKIDTASSNFGGTGDYIFLIKRFTESGTTATNSDSINIHVTSSIEPTPTPLPTSNPSSTPDPKLDSFAISDVPSSVDSITSFSTLVQINQLQANATYYIKGAFNKEATSNYFGKTFLNGNWIKNSSTATSQFKITTDSSGNWVGSLEVMPDSDDSGFTGTGTYGFKVARYNSDGSGLTWSNSVNLTINYIAVSTPAPTQKPTATPKPTTQPSAKSIISSLKSESSSSSFFPEEASIEGLTASNQDDQTQVLGAAITDNNSPIHWWLIGGGVFALIGSSIPLIKFSKFKDLNFLKSLKEIKI